MAVIMNSLLLYNIQLSKDLIPAYYKGNLQAYIMKKSSSKSHYNSKQHLTILNSQPKNIRQHKNNKTTSTVIHTEVEQNNHPTTTKKNSFNGLNNLNRVNSCVKIVSGNQSRGNSNCKAGNLSSSTYSKANILKLENTRNTGNSYRKAINHGKQMKPSDLMGTNKKNSELIQQNIALKQECLILQENQVKNKQKIQSLITRISELKNNTDDTADGMKLKEAEENDIGPSSRKKYLQTGTKSQKFTNKQKLCNNSGCMAQKKKLEHQLYIKRLKIQELENERKNWESSKQQLRSQYQQLLAEVRKIRSD